MSNINEIGGYKFSDVLISQDNIQIMFKITDFSEEARNNLEKKVYSIINTEKTEKKTKWNDNINITYDLCFELKTNKSIECYVIVDFCDTNNNFGGFSEEIDLSGYSEEVKKLILEILTNAFFK